MPFAYTPEGKKFLLGLEDRSHKRDKFKSQDVWLCFSGKREKRENVYETAIRELKEETKCCVVGSASKIALENTPMLWYRIFI